MKPNITPYNVYKNGDAFAHKDVASRLVFGNYPDSVDFSIFLLTYRRLSTLKHSVLSALRQKVSSLTYRVIVLDNSGLGTKEQRMNEDFLRGIIDDKLVYYVNEKNIGPGNWNRIFELSRSKYLSMLHDDDILYDDYIQLVERILKNGIMDNTAMLLPDKDYKLINNVDSQDLFLNSKPRSTKKIKIMKITENRMLFRGYSLQNSPSPGSIFDKDLMLEHGGYPYDAGPKLDDIPAWRLVKKHYVKTITNYPCGEYRLFSNDSLNVETMKNIVLKSCEIHACVYQKNVFWRFFYFIFASSLFTYQVNVQMATAKKCSVLIESNSFSPFVYRKRRIRLLILKMIEIFERIFLKYQYIEL